MTIPITGQPPVPDLSDPASFNTKALNLFSWMTGSMLDQFNAVDPADWFGVQSAPLDSGAGKVMTVGGFGLGATGAAPLLANLDATGTGAGLYRYAATTTGTKPAGIAADGSVLIIRGKDATSLVQVLYSGNGLSAWYRACVAGVFSAWRGDVRATTPEAEAGTGTGIMDATLTKAAIAAQVVSLGVGQTWVDVTGSRSTKTSYQNTTGRTIYVGAMIDGGGSGLSSPSLQVSADNVTFILVAGHYSTGGDGWGSGPIPAGYYYRYGGDNIRYWAELR